jgi:HEAT repeat protein
MTDADPAVRDASQLALGAQVRAGGDPALLRGVVEGFDPKADDARTRLRALGNSGVDATLDVALKALEAGDEGVRRAALEALRHVDVPVDDALWEGFGDTNPEVRLAAVRAAEAAGGAAADGLTDLAANDPSASVRAEALRALVSRRDDESVRETATALRSDSDPGVRAAAAALLAPATP